ncbi:DctP family TRAP transporter solute-binding subunit [Desulfogranum japonicum]|uniref:DctP family TRAP transporter solute-binding subunit n=1 Tax=Desulfogranum japonicum TaxID=231447 RepID=UPI00041A90F2|nr:DctP family TRAP transporter solute-binding subunit [Desulfogranum japonicum]
MQKLIWLFLCFFLVPPPSQGAARQLHLGVVTAPGAAQNIAAERFKKILEDSSDGQLTVKISHSASIGDETKILQQLQKGTIQLAVVTLKSLESFTPIVRVINYPFLFESPQQADEILDGPLGKEIFNALDPLGFKGLAFSENGFRSLSNSRQPVKTADDVKGLKIRVTSAPLHKATWQALGALPTPMPWPIYSDLERGVIDGQENPLWVMEVYNFFEVQKYLTTTNHTYSAHIDLASTLWWKKQSAQTQQLVQNAMYQAAVYQRQANRADEAERLQVLKEKGMIVEEHPDIQSFRTKVADLKGLDFYQEPQVQKLLVKILEATGR